MMPGNRKGRGHITQPLGLLSPGCCVIHLCSMLRILLTPLGCRTILADVMQHPHSVRMFSRTKYISKGSCALSYPFQVFYQALV